MKAKSLVIISVFILLLFTTNIGGVVKEVYAWDDCPKGLINDEYPGECARYIDTDENGICDHSEPAPEDRNNLDLNKKTASFQTENPKQSTSNNNENQSKIGVIAVLSILVPLTALVGYASIYRVKQNKKA